MCGTYEPELRFGDYQTQVSKYTYVGTYQSVKWMFFDFSVLVRLNALVEVVCKPWTFFSEFWDTGFSGCRWAIYNDVPAGTLYWF